MDLNYTWMGLKKHGATEMKKAPHQQGF